MYGVDVLVRGANSNGHAFAQSRYVAKQIHSNTRARLANNYDFFMETNKHQKRDAQCVFDAAYEFLAYVSNPDKNTNTYAASNNTRCRRTNERASERTNGRKNITETVSAQSVRSCSKSWSMTAFKILAKLWANKIDESNWTRIDGWRRVCVHMRLVVVCVRCVNAGRINWEKERDIANVCQVK